MQVIKGTNALSAHKMNNMLGNEIILKQQRILTVNMDIRLKSIQPNSSQLRKQESVNTARSQTMYHKTDACTPPLSLWPYLRHFENTPG